MKILVEVDNKIWGKVKNFATVGDITLSNAVQYLLSHALEELGFSKGENNDFN